MAMSRIELFIGHLIVAVPLVGLAPRLHVPAPVALVLGGVALGCIPLLPPIVLAPRTSCC